MKKDIDFYFDFISPYGYLASLSIDQIASKYGRSVRWRPLVLGISVMKVMGLPPVTSTPLKGPYALQDAPRFARYLGVPFKQPVGEMSPLPPLRAFVWLQRKDNELARRFAQGVYEAQWGHGKPITTATALFEVAEPLGISFDCLSRAIASQEVKDDLQNQVNDAIAAGVFGSPTFVIDGEMFWGVDRLPMVERWLDTGGW